MLPMTVELRGEEWFIDDYGLRNIKMPEHVLSFNALSDAEALNIVGQLETRMYEAQGLLDLLYNVTPQYEEDV